MNIDNDLVCKLIKWHLFFRDAVQNDAPKSSRSKDYIKGRGRGNADRGSDRGRGRGSSNLIQVY